MANAALGFWRGFSALFSALRTLAGMPRVWPLMLVPAVVFSLLELTCVALSWHFLEPWVARNISGSGALHRFGTLALTLGLVTIAGVLGWVVAGLLTPMLSSPALERVVLHCERQLGVPERRPLGFWAELGCGARSLLVSSLLTLPLLLGLTLLELVAPPTAVVVTPLKIVIGALGIAWGLFDYPMTLRGLGARARLGFMGRHFSAMLGFGAAFTLVFWVPCFGTLMLPVGVAAATALYWSAERGAAA
jgi:uncharacterized protein involved in cysteine biosynthesis